MKQYVARYTETFRSIHAFQATGNTQRRLEVYVKVKVKVKCTLVQALRFCTGRTAHRESRGIAVLFLDHGTRGSEGSASRPGRSLPPEKDTVPIVEEAAWAPGPV